MLSVDTMYRPNVESWSLLLAFTLSLVAVALALHMWLRRAERNYPWLDGFYRSAATVVVATLLADAIVFTSSGMISAWHVIVAVLAVGTALAAVTLHRPVSEVTRFSPLLSRMASQGLLLALFLAAASWSGYRLHHSLRVTEAFGLTGDAPGTLLEVSGQVLITDRGRILPVFRWDVAQEVFNYYASRSDSRLQNSHPASIFRAPPDARANCHGWIFTGGAHLLRGREVAALLADNGYQVVDRPEINDLVIYRRTSGEILHTGLVRGILDDGTVLVESKWGLEGRYLHRPEDQPYSTLFHYYRSRRAGHRVPFRSSDASSPSNRLRYRRASDSLHRSLSQPS
ncbi:MAG: hypothetical protein ACYC6N_12960 [Pirellulaceae bacterium]